MHNGLLTTATGSRQLVNRFDALAAAAGVVGARGRIQIETVDNPGWMVTIDAASLPATVASLGTPSPPFWPGSQVEARHCRVAGPADALGAMLDALRGSLGSTFHATDDVVDALTAWYLEQCDGDWEHAYGATMIGSSSEWAIELRSDVRLDKTTTAALAATGAAVEQMTWSDGEDGEEEEGCEWTVSVRGAAPWSALAAVLDVLRAVNADAAPDRAELLARLVAFEGGIAALRHAVRTLPSDADEPLVALTAWHVDDVLRRAANDELDADEVEEWANLLEVREDVDFEPAAASAIFDLANPEIQGALTPERLADLRAALATD